MREFNELMSSIEKGNYLPFYLLSGVEPYFIDQIESKITDHLLDEASRSFDYSLFYGKVEIEGRNQGIEFSRTEQFGQWPLQVNDFKHIHDSLEATMAYQAIDSGETSELSGRRTT